MRLKSPVPQLSVQLFVQANNKYTSTLYITGASWEESIGDRLMLHTKASNTGNISIYQRHYEYNIYQQAT